jgi:hypothetical protein
MSADFVLRFNREATVQIITHETGHTLNLRHTNTDVPTATNAPGCYNFAKDNQTDWGSRQLPQSPGRLEWGFDVETKTLIDPSTTFDVMSYCIPRWISPLRFFTAARRRDRGGAGPRRATDSGRRHCSRAEASGT